MLVLIGAPVYKRAWILPYWFEAIENQTWPLHELGFVFEAAPDDEETVEMLFAWQAQHPQVSIFDVRINDSVPHEDHQTGDPRFSPFGINRRWTKTRYRHMATLRNSLLDRVNSYNPDRYFSLDTDILLENPITIAELVRFTEGTDGAAAPLAYMSATSDYPNVMTWVKPGEMAVRDGPGMYPLGVPFSCDVIMAAKMMTPAVYSTVRYSYHPLGEDIGWSAACYHLGHPLWSHGIYTPHIMSTHHLEHYLSCGDDRRKSPWAAQSNDTPDSGDPCAFPSLLV